MIGLHLAIDHLNSPVLQLTDQMGKGNLGRIGAAREHRFAVEHPANGQAIEPAHQFTVHVGFDRVCPTEFKEVQIGGANLGGDPGAGLTGTGCLGAAIDDACEVMVEAYLEGALTQGFAQ